MFGYFLYHVKFYDCMNVLSKVHVLPEITSGLFLSLVLSAVADVSISGPVLSSGTMIEWYIMGLFIRNL